jgi:hypothetical protein
MSRRRLLLLELASATRLTPRIAPLVLLPLPDGRAAVPLVDTTVEEALATLLAEGVAIRKSRVIDA